MSRNSKTQERKRRRQEDREDAVFVNERLKELGPDPGKWKTISLAELLSCDQEKKFEVNGDGSLPPSIKADS